MSAWIWLVLTGVAGLIAGFFIGRSSSAGVKRSLQLDQELRDVRGELDRYRNSVVEHFTGTAQLVNKLTADYREMYQHLSRGAQELAGGRTPHIESLAAPQVERIPAPSIVDEFLDDEAAVRGDFGTAQPGRTPRTEGWYDDVAPGTEVPDYAREESHRRTNS